MCLRLLTSIVLLLSIAEGVAAQDEATADDVGVETPEDAEAQAQRYFMEAREAFDAQRYADAQRLLEDSLSLAPRPATAINLARVLRSLGKHLEVITILDALVEGRYGEVDEERVREARELLQEARAALAHIVVSARGEDSVSIRVDGVQVDELADGDSHAQEVDPGEHVVVGVTGDGRLREVGVELAPGERRAVALTFAPRPEERAVEAEADGPGISPWVWVGIAVGALAVGAAVLAIVLVTSNGGTVRADEIEDPQGAFPVIEALRW